MNIPTQFIAASRYMVSPSFRVINDHLECRGFGGDIILTTALMEPHPDFEWFAIKKWPTMEANTLQIKPTGLHFKYQGQPQKAAIESSREFPEGSHPDYSHDVAYTEQSITADETLHLDAVKSFMSRDETRYVLMGALCGKEYVATDGRRLIELKSGYTGTPFIMPAAVVNILVTLHKKIPSTFWRWNLNEVDGEIVDVKIDTDSFTVQFKAVGGNYPNWRQVIPVIDQKTVHFIPAQGDLPSFCAWLRGRNNVTFTPHRGKIMVYDNVTTASAFFSGYLSAQAIYNGDFFKSMLEVPGLLQMSAEGAENSALFEFHRGTGVLMPMRGNVDDNTILEAAEHLLAIT